MIDMTPAMGKGFQIQNFDKEGINHVLLLAAGSGIAPLRAAIESEELGLAKVHPSTHISIHSFIPNPPTHPPTHLSRCPATPACTSASGLPPTSLTRRNSLPGKRREWRSSHVSPARPFPSAPLVTGVSRSSHLPTVHTPQRVQTALISPTHPPTPNRLRPTRVGRR